jgi:hypothetical protein
MVGMSLCESAENSFAQYTQLMQRPNPMLNVYGNAVFIQHELSLSDLVSIHTTCGPIPSG